MSLERVSLDRGRLEISPEPTAQERAAIVAALEKLVAGVGPSAPGAWWEAGLREGLDDATDDEL